MSPTHVIVIDRTTMIARSDMHGEQTLYAVHANTASAWRALVNWIASGALIRTHRGVFVPERRVVLFRKACEDKGYSVEVNET